MDLTLFAVTRATDVLVGELWAQRKARRIASGKWTKVCLSTFYKWSLLTEYQVEKLASTLSDSSILACL